jgi:NTE family protein
MTTKALVLSGGGPVGIAWECGLVAGLAQAGVDLSTADFILGTSAGSFVGARLAMGASPADMAAPFLVMDESKPLPQSPRSPASAAPAKAPDLAPLMRMMVEASSGTRPAQEVRAEIGAWALGAQTMSEEAFIASFGRSLSELPADAWPKRGYACTAVDAVDGAFRLWTRESRVGLARAVASSCSVPGIYPPITIDGRRYIDGGMRSGTNADMATGYDLVVVVAIRAAAPGGQAAERARMIVEGELKTLREAGARVELIVPDAASLEALGANLMDAGRRPGAAAAGYAQGQSGPGPEALRAVWVG